MATFYVTLWDFELEESGEIVKDGLVFTTREAAKAQESNAFLSSIDNDLAARVEPHWSKRLNASGFITGESSIIEIDADNPEAALQGAIKGEGIAMDE